VDLALFRTKRDKLIAGIVQKDISNTRQVKVLATRAIKVSMQQIRALPNVCYVPIPCTVQLEAICAPFVKKVSS